MTCGWTRETTRSSWRPPVAEILQSTFRHLAIPNNLGISKNANSVFFPSKTCIVHEFRTVVVTKRVTNVLPKVWTSLGKN